MRVIATLHLHSRLGRLPRDLDSFLLFRAASVTPWSRPPITATTTMNKTAKDTNPIATNSMTNLPQPKTEE